jgi:hypothetical protein
MSALQHPPEHQVAALARQVGEELSGLAEAPLWSMSAVEAGSTLLVLTEVRGQLDELVMRVLRHASSVGTGLDLGASSTTSWWAHATRTTRAEAHRTFRLAAALERHQSVRVALAAGELRTDQAAVIVDAVDALPGDVGIGVPGEATASLLAHAVELDARALRIVGRRVLEVVDPEAADAEEARRLEAEERAAHLSASFTMTDDGRGRCHGRFTMPSLHGAMLRKDLMARAAAARRTSTPDDPPGGVGGGRFSRHRLGLAFLDYVETRPEDSIPSAGGVPATVVVTMELETLLGGLRAASLDTGGRISAGEARRLACRAGIVPLVLGGPSVVLDVGRKRRFHSEAQRIAMGVRDQGCTAHGCDAPPALCHAHHDETPWSRGGGTSVAMGRLLCPRHHTLIHDINYHHTLDKHGQVRFTRRT